MRRMVLKALSLIPIMMENSETLVNFIRRRFFAGTPQYRVNGQQTYGQPAYQHEAYGEPGYQHQTYGQPPPYGHPPPQYAQPPPYSQQRPGMPNTAQPSAPPEPDWVDRPEGIVPGCPPGLEYLLHVDQLLVKQQVEIFEVLTGWETKNRYKITNSMDQQVYFATEESDSFSRQCCKSQRGFVMHITDNANQEVIRVSREYKGCAGCCWCAFADCCAHEITIEAPVGQVVGYVRQKQSCMEPRYSIMNAEHIEILNIAGPVCVCSDPRGWDREFKVYSHDGRHQVGKISKQWGGLMKEMFTNADNFGVSFPIDLDVRMKAVMVGVVFLIDFMFFENKHPHKRRD